MSDKAVLCKGSTAARGVGVKQPHACSVWQLSQYGRTRRLFVGADPPQRRPPPPLTPPPMPPPPVGGHRPGAGESGLPPPPVGALRARAGSGSSSRPHLNSGGFSREFGRLLDLAAPPHLSRAVAVRV